MAEEYTPPPIVGAYVPPPIVGAYVPPPIVEEESEDKQFYDDTLLGELGEGVASGVTKLVEGVSGLAAIPVDAATGSNYGDQITQAGEDLRDSLGLDPEGFVGKGSEIVSQFVYLPVKLASMAGRGYQALRAARLGKTKAATTPLTRGERFGLAASQIGAAGLGEIAVTTDGTTTIGDWVEMGPTQTEDLIGLRGQEKAMARLRNRLRSTAEATGLGAGVAGALGALGRTSAGQGVAKAVSAKLDKVGQNIDDLLYQRMTARPGTSEELGFFKSKLADAIAFSRYRGFLPDEVATKRLLIEGEVSAEIKKAERTLKQLDKQIDVSLKKMKPNSQLDRVGIMSKVEEFLTETDLKTKAGILGQIPADLRPNVQAMRDHVDSLSERLKGGSFLSSDPVTPDGNSIKDIIDDGIGSYLRRRYRVFEDAKYTPTRESIDAARSFFQGNKTATEKELTRLSKADPFNSALDEDFMLKNGLSKTPDGEIKVGAQVTPAAAQKAQEAFLSKYAVKGRAALGGGRVARDRLDTNMFIDRENVPKALRQLMGEIDDPKQAYLGTVADLAQFNAVDDYFGTVAKLAEQNQGVGKLFVDASKLSPEQQAGLVEQGYVRLGSKEAPTMVGASGREMTEVEELVNTQGWGSLSGYMVPQSIYKDLTNAVLAEDSFGALITRGVIGTFLKGKGISQYSKTVLSPITQIRNFTTAVSFGLANGNVPIIGRGGSLSDSAKLVFSNITSKGSDEVFADLADAQNRGVLGTNAELREIQDTLSKGVDVTARGPRNFSEAVLGEKLGGALRKGTKPLEDLYQGSDDFWKYFSYNAEQAKIRNALAKATDEQKIAYLTKGRGVTTKQKAQDGLIEELIKDRAAQIVRDTVPNYSKAGSELVRFGRKLPVGSFITFPAEMYRTSFNIVRQAIDDMASDIPAIQARGRQRLIGFTTVAGVAPLAAVDLGSAMSGVPKEIMEAYKRSFGAPWEKGAILIPIEQDEDGNVKYFNYSTSNPYDTLFRFANRAFTEADAAISSGQSVDKVFTDTMIATLGEAFAPFMDEAMLTESLLDISVRGGKTSTGAQVYNPEDSSGTKGQKMFNHVLDTLMPSLIPLNVSSGEFEPSRFARGVIGSQFPDLIDPKDKFQRERNLTEEVFRQFSGVTPLEFNLKKNLGFAAGRLNRAQGNAKRIFNRHTDDGNATGDSLFEAYVASNEAKLRVDREYYRMVKDLEIMGLTTSEIRRELKKQGISGARDILRNEFEPFKLSDRNKKDMRETGKYAEFPRQKYLEYRRAMKNVPLDVPLDVELPSSSVESGYTPPPVVSDYTPPPVVSAPAPAPVAQPQQQQAPNRSFDLLGSNPIDALRNFEILQRITGGQ